MVREDLSEEVISKQRYKEHDGGNYADIWEKYSQTTVDLQRP